MGNCQAVDAAAMVIQYPSGKIERLYWPIPAADVIKANPGHYVSLIIPLPPAAGDAPDAGVPPEKKTVRYTRVKLLRPTDTLALGHAYRLLTEQEVMKVLRAKKYKKKKGEVEASKLEDSQKQSSSTEMETTMKKQVVKEEQKARERSHNPAAVGRSKSWRPSLQSISEASG